MIKKIAFSLLFLAVLAGCSVANKVERRYEGQGRDILFHEFGEPHKIIELKDGNQLFIYMKETYVRETTFDAGRSATLDPRVSPGFIKEETYRFTINEDGIITDANYERVNK